jgi:large subunit ribosomal protein L10
MANQKILDQKQLIINEIADKVKNSNSVVFFEYQGLTVTETNELRRKLKEAGSEYKVYKNTLATRALNDLKIDVGTLEGPKAIAFSSDAVAPIKVLADFAKAHPALELKVGIVDGNVTDTAGLKALSTIPSREGLLTMLAGGMIATVKDLAICLDLYSKNLEK